MEILQSADILNQTVYPCLFGFKYGGCSYFLSQPISFSLGEGISAFGLILAVYQLKKTSWDIRLSIFGKISNIIWLFGILGLFSLVLATVISVIPFGYYIIYPPFNQALFYEIIAVIFFILSPLSMFLLGTKRKIFYPPFADFFYFRLHRNIERVEEKRLEACVDIIFDNLDLLVEACLPSNSNQNTKGRAHAIFAVILGERRVADYIVTKRMDFLLSLFWHLKKYPLASPLVRECTDVIFQRLLQNESSFLYQQLDRKGLSLSANLFEDIFSSHELTSSYKLFEALPYHFKFSGERLLTEVYIRCLEETVKSHLLEKRDFTSDLSQGFKVLNSYTDSLFSDIITGKVSKEDFRNHLGSITYFLGHTFVYAFKEALERDTVSDFDKRFATGRRPAFGAGLLEAYLNSLYELIFNISKVFLEGKEDEWYIRHELDNAYFGLFYEAGFITVRDELIALIWKQINEKNIQGSFPVVLKTYIALMPWWDDRKGGSWIDIEKEKVRVVLGGLKANFLKEAKMRNNKDLMVEALLPPSFFYNKSKNKIYYVSQFNEEVEIV